MLSLVNVINRLIWSKIKNQIHFNLFVWFLRRLLWSSRRLIESNIDQHIMNSSKVHNLPVIGLLSVRRRVSIKSFSFKAHLIFDRSMDDEVTRDKWYCTQPYTSKDTPVAWSFASDSVNVDVMSLVSIILLWFIIQWLLWFMYTVQYATHASTLTLKIIW